MANPQRKTNWFAIWISVAVVAVVVVAGIVVVALNNAATSGGTPPAASNVNAETGAIAFGGGPDEVDTYVDFMCPICNQFEQMYGETLQGLVDEGKITLNVHPVSILDRVSQGTQFSTRAANAMYCVNESSSPEVATIFMQMMYANQPDEQSAGLTDDQIVAIAETAGATGIDDCVAGGEFSSFVAAKTKLIPTDANGQSGTPTVVVNGTRIDLTGDPQADIVDRLQG